MTLDLEKLRALAECSLPMPVVTAQIAHETYCPRIGGPVTLNDGRCPECGWRHNPHSYSTVHIDARDLLALVEEVECFRADASELKRVTEKHERLQERLTEIEKANVDRWRDGYAAAQRQIAAWLRAQADIAYDNSDAHHALWMAAEAIGRGDRREEEP